MAASELSKRVSVAALGIPLVVAGLYVGRWALGPILALLCAGAALELYRLAERRGIHAVRIPGAVAGGGLVLIAMVHPSVAAAAPALWSWLVVLALAVALAVIRDRGVEGRPLPAIGVTVAGALLPGAAMCYIIFLRHLPVEPQGAVGGNWAALVGVALVAYPLAVTWVTDSAAFFGGRRWGRRPLVPSVSPKKTVEGAVAGLVGGVLAGWVVAHLVLRLWLGVPISPVAGAAGGLVVSVVSQLGDLAESVWKREAGVKDSGGLFPGHGGILDRMDALIFTIPVSYWLLVAMLPGVGV